MINFINFFIHFLLVSYDFPALTKKDSITLKFPQRKFMGESAALMSNLDKELKRIIFEKFKKMPNQ